MMGWSSWNAFRINIDEEKIKAQADLMARNGMKEAGYNYINIDDGFFGGRDEQGVLYANDKFPSGMKALADYLHDRGFKAGIYTDAGITRCAARYDADPNFPEGGGCYGYRALDFDTFFNVWGYDFVKVDWCGGEVQELDQQEEYVDIAQHLSEIERAIEWEICSWGFPGEWATELASHWRISQDIDPTFASIVDIIDKNADLAQYAQPGHYNHMDMLQVGNGMSYEEDQAHFSMWAMMSSPLITGNDLRTMSAETLAILTNEEVIAVNQDALGLQAQRVMQKQDTEVWYKPIEQYEKGAIALFNRSEEAQDITVNWADIGLDAQAVTDLAVRDLWQHQDQGSFKDSYTATVPAHGIVMLTVSGDGDLRFSEKEHKE